MKRTLESDRKDLVSLGREQGRSAFGFLRIRVLNKTSLGRTLSSSSSPLASRPRPPRFFSLCRTWIGKSLVRVTCTSCTQSGSSYQLLPPPRGCCFHRVVVVVVVVVHGLLLLLLRLLRLRLRRPSSSTVIEKQTARTSITVVGYDRVDTPCACVPSPTRKIPRRTAQNLRREGERERRTGGQAGLFSRCTLHSAILFRMMFTGVNGIAHEEINGIFSK